MLFIGLQVNRKPVPAARRRRGFSYLEATVSLVILGMGLFTGMELYGSYARGSIIEQERTVALQLCADLMEEILSKDFEDQSLSPGSFGIGAQEHGREDFDDVDDFDNWLEDPPEDLYGDPLPGCDGYLRAVSIWNVDEDDMVTPRGNGASAAKAIEVAVYRKGKPRVRLIGHRTRYTRGD